jgi:hypothetical protein
MATVQDTNTFRNWVWMFGSSFLILSIQIWQRGNAVAQLVEALRYKPEGSTAVGFNLMLNWNPHYDPGIASVSKEKWVPGGQTRSENSVDNISSFTYPPCWNLGASTSWIPQGPVQAATGIALYLPYNQMWQNRYWTLFCKRCPVGFKAGSSWLFARISVLLQVKFPSHLGGEEV